MTIALILALLFAPNPPPNLRAQWDNATSATVSWSQTARGCLYAKSGRVFVGCWEGEGRVVVLLGHEGPMDAAYRPQANEVYQLVTGGGTYSARLTGRSVYLPAQLGGQSNAPV